MTSISGLAAAYPLPWSLKDTHGLFGTLTDREIEYVNSRLGYYILNVHEVTF